MRIRKLFTLLLSSTLLFSTTSAILVQATEGGTTDDGTDQTSVQTDPGNNSGTGDGADTGNGVDTGNSDVSEGDNSEDTGNGDISDGDNNGDSGNSDGSIEEPDTTPPPVNPPAPPAPPTQPTQPVQPTTPYYPTPDYTLPETPSVAPEDIEGAEVVETPEVQTTPEIEEEETSLLEGPYVAFSANIFLTEEEADEFIQMIADDPEAGDRFVTEKIENQNGSFIVTVEYAEDASLEGRPILFYVETAFDNQEEAAQYMNDHLLMYPDVFYDAEVLAINDIYNVVFAIQTKADTQAITYDQETLELEYLAQRRPYTYSVYADENGEFNDLIQPAVEEAFPGEFTFESEQISDTEMQVTMTPVETEESSTSDSVEVDETAVSEETTESTEE